MKIDFKPIVTALALLTALAGHAQAQVSTGSLVGWEAFGDVVSADGKITLTTAFLDGADDEASNLSGKPALDVLFDDLAGKAGVDITAFDIGGQFAVEGSLVKQSFGAVAGQTLSFDWSFVTQETTYLDNAFFIIDGQLQSLASTAQPGTGTQNYRYTFGQSGPLTLSFGVIDTDSSAGVSSLSVSNLQVFTTAPVPEPASWAMFAAGLGMLGWFASRRGKAVA